MLIDNKRILQAKNKPLVEILNSINPSGCEIIQAKNGMDTLVVMKNEQKISYHSRYNPAQEASTVLANQIKPSTDYVLLIGVGLGYIIQELIEKHPDVRFSIYEPDIEVISTFLNTFNLRKIRSQKLDFIFRHPLELDDLGKLYKRLTEKNAQIIISPIASSLYENEIENFMTGLKKYIEINKNSLITDLMFQMRWTVNSIVNFKEVLDTPNFFNHIKIESLRNKPALIIAAGPSLDDEIENIRLIKEHGKAYIFAVGSAVNTLIKHNIMPDALFSYDPTFENTEVVKKVKELKIPIPLIFGSSIAYEVLEDYPGEKFHFLTSQDSINTNLIRHESNIIPDAPTIAAITLYILGGIKMDPIILVGQNLSVTKEKMYADGIDYFGENTLSEDKLKTYKKLTSTTGQEIYTENDFMSMKNAIEAYIIQVGLEGKVYNTTKNGLPINGAPFIPLEDILEENLQQNNIVDLSIFEGENNYNIEEAIKNFKHYEEYFDDLIGDFKKLVSVDKQIRESYEKKLINKLQNHFNEFDKYFNRIEKNPFFLQTLAPITRTQYKQLVDRSDEVRYERRPLQKMEKYIDIYSKYIRTMYVGIIQIQPAFAELKKSDLFKKEDSQ